LPQAGRFSESDTWASTRRHLRSLGERCGKYRVNLPILADLPTMTPLKCVFLAFARYRVGILP
jgi:hypothetical protein